METKSLLRVDLGNSVAEFDQALDRYFVETAIRLYAALRGYHCW